MHYVALFFAGAFLCNTVPHLVAGLMGLPFPSPFAKPPGEGDTAPPINLLWGAANLAIGLYLLSLRPPPFSPGVETATLGAGALIMGLMLARHFGGVQRRKASRG